MTEETALEEKGEATVYETGFIIDPALSDEDVTAVVTAFKSAITEKGGGIISEEAPKRRELAYTIIKSILGKNKRYSAGFFGWVKYETLPSTASAIKIYLESDLKIVRFLTVKTVRENTLVYQRTGFVPRVDGERPAPKKEIPNVQEGATPVVISEEELDKSIEKLIV
jgi:ribosomal protein S6